MNYDREPAWATGRRVGARCVNLQPGGIKGLRNREASTMGFKAGPESLNNTRTCPRSSIAARSVTVACLALALLGCYTPNQQVLEKEVRNLARPGMPASAAVANLSSRGFECTGEPITCSRIRQRLLPSSCVERVNLELADQSAVLRTIDVRPIACAGL